MYFEALHAWLRDAVDVSVDAHAARKPPAETTGEASRSRRSPTIGQNAEQPNSSRTIEPLVTAHLWERVICGYAISPL